MWNFRHSGLKTSRLSVNPESCRQTLLLLSSEGEALKENLPKKKKMYSLQFFLSTQTKSAAYCRNIMKSRECPEQLQVAQSASGYSSSRSSSRNAGRSETPVLRSGQGENFFLFVFQFFFQLFQKLRRLEGTLPPSPAVWRLNTRWWHLLVISWSCWSYRPAAPLMLKQKKQRHSEMKFCLKI